MWIARASALVSILSVFAIATTAGADTPTSLPTTAASPPAPAASFVHAAAPSSASPEPPSRRGDVAGIVLTSLGGTFLLGGAALVAFDPPSSWRDSDAVLGLPGLASLAVGIVLTAIGIPVLVGSANNASSTSARAPRRWIAPAPMAFGTRSAGLGLLGTF